MFLGAIYPKPKSKKEEKKKIENVMRQLVDIYGLHPKLVSRVAVLPWMDNKKELAAHYKMSDVVVMPMQTPGLYSMAAFDAMALGVPVVSSEGNLSIGRSINEQEIFNSVDFCFSKKNKDAVYQKVTEAYNAVKNEYNPSQFLKRHLEVYKSLMRRS